MSDRTMYAGFDLGTTNSAAAVFDGERVVPIRNAEGAALTPSVVRIDGKGRVTVGRRAYRHLERDPDNTRSEFKRLMGTDRKLSFAASGREHTPEELAALVLSGLRDDMKEQLGIEPARAVISVPALFELPQSRATSEAARLAGFDYVELIQEPVASALAAGWRDSDVGSWLVYDLGGGTFDVSLLDTREGLLRVVGHDGDNFLGGRDFDRAIVDHFTAQLAERDGVQIRRDNPAHQAALRTLKHLAEDAKIQLSRRDRVELDPSAPLLVDGEEIEPDFTLDRATLETLCVPVVDRSLRVCERLVAAHGLRSDDLSRIVLVGGPTAMPFVRQRVADHLGVKVAEGYDPMTLVASGAALYAATAGIEVHPVGPAVADIGGGACKLWLQYPPVSADLTPHVVGRISDSEGNPVPATITLTRAGDGWTSEPIAVDEKGAFISLLSLEPRRANRFGVEAVDGSGTPIEVTPSEIAIVHGMTIGDPPLSRSVGIALADDSVHTYFERGTALPAKRTFTHHTVQTVGKGIEGAALKIPMVQGEFAQAHLCRLVGSLEIAGDALRGAVPSGTPIEVTLEIDRGGCLSGTALITRLEQTFDAVVHLVVPDADPEALATSLSTLRERVAAESSQAFRRGDPKAVGAIQSFDDELSVAQRDLEAARGGDTDAGQRASRTLLEIDSALAEMELERRWPELEDECHDDLVWAIGWVSEYGTDNEKRLIERTGDAMERARGRRNVREMERQRRSAQRLGHAAFSRNPEAWSWMFDDVASKVHEANDVPAAQRLVKKGRKLVDKGDNSGLRSVVRQLWALFPPSADIRRMSFDSTVR